MIIKKQISNTLLTLTLILFSAAGQAKLTSEAPATEFTGVATYYNDSYHGKRTASGELYDKYKLTTVHKHLPFGTLLRVTNLSNHRSVVVKVNDRAPLRKNHILDLSKQAALDLDFINAGRIKVKVETVQLGRS